MKNLYKAVGLILSLVFATQAVAQIDIEQEDDEWYRSESKFYWSSGWETIFSWSNTSHPTSNEGVVIRWAPVFNVHGFANYDFSRWFGIMGGLSIRNVGYIYQFDDVNEQSFRKKFRTYNAGIPVGIKIGNVDGFHVFGGYTVEFPFHYKEKTFDNDGDRIDRKRVWFSERVNPVQQAVFLGLQLKEGLNLKLQYYLTEFHDQSFSQTTPDMFPPSGVGTLPYDDLETNVWSISMQFTVSQKNYKYYKPSKRNR